MNTLVILLLLMLPGCLLGEEVGWGFLAKGQTTGFAKWGVGKKSPEAWLRHISWRPPNPLDPATFRGPHFSGHGFVHLDQQRGPGPYVGDFEGPIPITAYGHGSAAFRGRPDRGPGSDPGSALLGWPEGGPFGDFGPWFVL